MTVCALEYFLKAFLFVLLCVMTVQFFGLRESFSPWNNHGGLAIRQMPSRTGTTRHEYKFVAKNYPFKGRKQSEYSQVAPITAHQINKRNEHSFL
tara:strand:+ start:270 stop:554 length:285 start_codon:yes stop_codon:yes gene_type:complete